MENRDSALILTKWISLPKEHSQEIESKSVHWFKRTRATVSVALYIRKMQFTWDHIYIYIYIIYIYIYIYI